MHKISARWCAIIFSPLAVIFYSQETGAGKKLDSAEKKGMEIWSEADFMEKLNS